MEEKPCRLCQIIYNYKIAKVKELAGSRNLLAVMEELPAGIKRILVIPKNPKFLFTELGDGTKTEEGKELEELLIRIFEKISKEIKPHAVITNGAGLSPCERGKEIVAGKKFHQCIVILIMEK